MKTLHFSIEIKAPVARVWNVMLAPDTYSSWTTPFCAGSYYEGSWDKGAQIRFLAPNGDGMDSVIEDNQPHRFISIRHESILHQGTVDTDSEEARKWLPSHENYTFLPRDAGTELRIEMDMGSDAYEQYLLDAWPKALATLKALCEQPAMQQH